MTLLNYTDYVPTPTPLTSGTTIQSYVDPTGLVWVAKNGVNGGQWARATDAVHCKLYRGATWTSSGTATAIVMDTVVYDTYGMKGSTGIVLPVAGMYRFSVSCAVTGTATGQWISLTALLNAANVGANNNTTAQAGSGTLQTTVADLLRANAGDELKLSVATLAAYTGVLGILTNLSASYIGTG